MLWLFFNDTATTEIYTLSLHDALPICPQPDLHEELPPLRDPRAVRRLGHLRRARGAARAHALRSEEHTSELQSRQYLVCRLLLEKNKPYFYLSHVSSHASHLSLIPATA